MMTREQSLRIIEEIKKKFGDTIDLNKSPFVLIEILSNFGRFFDGPGSDDTVSTVAVGISTDTGGGGGMGAGGTGSGGTSPGTGGGGGVSPGTSTVAVGITPPTSNRQVEIEEILRVVLRLQKDIKGISQQLERLGVAK
jgi:hypothetical protein